MEEIHLRLAITSKFRPQVREILAKTDHYRDLIKVLDINYEKLRKQPIREVKRVKAFKPSKKSRTDVLLMEALERSDLRGHIVIVKVDKLHYMFGARKI